MKWHHEDDLKRQLMSTFDAELSKKKDEKVLGKIEQ